jgi:anti-sigma regulatory factor (Ser/Thr protein kinase)
VATVELRFSATPAHVRTARLVAASLARRSGVDDSLLDEVRLAVGEACLRAVGLHARAKLDDPVEVRLHTDGGRFSIEVADSMPLPDAGASSNGSHSTTAEALLDADPDALGDSLGLALITGLVDDVQVSTGAGGAVVRMSWPVGAA